MPNVKILREREGMYRDKMKKNYDKRHRTRDLDRLNPGEQVYSRRERKQYTVVRKHHNPRSYLLRGADGDVKRRNRKEIVRLSEVAPSWKSEPSGTVRDLPLVRRKEVIVQQRWKRELPRRSSRQNKGTLPERYRD